MLERAEGPTKYNALHLAIKYHHLQIVQFLLENGIKVNDACKGNVSPLHIAAKEGNLEIINLLLKNGAKKRLTDENGKYPYQYAEENNKPEAAALLAFTETDEKEKTDEEIKTKEKSEFSYEQSNDWFPPNYFKIENKVDQTKDYTRAFTCIECGQEKKLKRILEENPDVVNYIEVSTGNSLVHTAVLTENQQIIRLLLSSGADINSRNIKNGMTPLHYAIMKSAGITQFILNQGGDDQVFDYTGETPAMMQLRYYNKEMEKYNEMMKIVILGTKEEMSDFVKENPKLLNVRRKDGKKLIHIAAILGLQDLVKMSLENDISIDTKDKEGNTALHYAAFYDNEEMASFLIKSGASLNAMNQDGQAPMHVAASRGYRLVLELFIEKCGIDFESQVKETSLFYSVRNHLYDVTKILLARGANPNFVSGQDETVLQIINSLDIDDNTKKLFIKLLLKYKIDLNRANAKGQTIIYDCIYARSISVLKYLIAKGAAVNTADINGNSPLHIAAIKDLTEICGILLKAGANANVKNKSDNMTPSEAAEKAGNHMTAKLIKLYEAE